MALYVVRHAKAGSRHDWSGPDQLRPLSKRGRKQAEAIAAHLTPSAPNRVLSSPYVRCIQTVEPLAAQAGVAIEASDALAEGQDFRAPLALVESLEDGAVLCTHGDVLPELLNALIRRGLLVDGSPDLRKGVVWSLERNRTGQLAHATVTLSPAD